MKKKQFHFSRDYIVPVIIMFIVLSIPCFARAYEREINTLSSAMAEKIENTGKKTIAVVDFTDLEGDVTQLGRFIAEELSGALASAGKGFEVVNRNNLKLILQEHKLFETGLIDPKAAMRLGEVAGIEALVTGTITPFTENVRLSVSVLDINTAKVIDNKKENIPRTKDIDELLRREIVPSKLAKPIEIATPTPKPKSAKKLVARGFTFEVKECKRAGKDVTCYMLITNNQSQDRYLNFGYAGYAAISVYLYDDLGNQYDARRGQFGNKEENHRSIKNLLISGVPLKASLSFENVSYQANNVAALTIHNRDDNGYFKINILDIPISD